MCCGGMILENVPADERTVARVMAHAGAPAEVGPEQNAALLDAETENRILRGFKAHLWIEKGGSATCSHCGNRSEPYHQGHKSMAACPSCGRSAEVRYLRYGRKRLQDEFYAVKWMKSEVDRNACVMIGYFCRADYNVPDPAHAKKLIVPVLVDSFRYGKGATRIQRAVWSWGEPEGLCSWSLRRDVRAIGSAYFGHKVEVVKDSEGFAAAIAGTPFRSAVATLNTVRARQGYTYIDDRSELMDAIARKPWIEYVAKAGFERIAQSATRYSLQGALNQRKKSVREILKLSPDRYAELKGKRADIKLETLRILQILDAGTAKANLKEAQAMARRIGAADDLKRIIARYGQADRRLVRYLLKNNWRDLMDYWRLANGAGIDLSLPGAMLPPNLSRAHDALVDAERDFNRLSMAGKCEALQEKLDKLLPALEKKYCFEHAGLILCPARKLIELVDEGNALHHCVGGYYRNYAEGKTVICFLRHADVPDEPWRTIEIHPASGAVIQDRGYRNDRDAAGKSTMTPELQAQLDDFWTAFRLWSAKARINVA